MPASSTKKSSEEKDTEIAKNQLAVKDRQVLAVDKIKSLVDQINAAFKEENVKKSIDAMIEFQQYIRATLDNVKKATDVQAAQLRLKTALGNTFENLKIENPKFFVQLLEAATELSGATEEHNSFIEEGKANNSNTVAYSRLYKSMQVVINGLRLLTAVAQDERRDYEKEDPQFTNKINNTISDIKNSLGFDGFENYVRDVFKIKDSKEANYLTKLEKCDFIEDFFKRDATTWSYLSDAETSEPKKFIPATYKPIFILEPTPFKAAALALKKELPRDEKGVEKLFDDLDNDLNLEWKAFWDKVRIQNSDVNKEILDNKINALQQQLLFAYRSKVISLVYKNMKYDRGPFVSKRWEKELQARNIARKNAQMDIEFTQISEFKAGPQFQSNDQIKKWLHNRLENIRFLCEKEGNLNPESKENLDKLINILYQGGGIRKVIKELTSIWNAVLSSNKNLIPSLDAPGKFFDRNVACLLRDIGKITKHPIIPRDLKIKRPLLDRPMAATKEDFDSLISECKKHQEKDEEKRWERVVGLVKLHKEFADLGFCTLKRAYAGALTEIEEIFANQARDPKEESKKVTTPSFKQSLYEIIDAERYKRLLALI